MSPRLEHRRDQPWAPPRFRGGSAWWGLCFLLAALLGGCGDQAHTAAAWIESAAAAHAEADTALEAAQVGQGRDALVRFLAEPIPADMAAEDVRVVRQDAHWRLAEMALDDGEPVRALRHANGGLAEGRGRDVFTANLLVSRGRAREALNDPLRAASDYHEALQINDALLHELLDGVESE